MSILCAAGLGNTLTNCVSSRNGACCNWFGAVFFLCFLVYLVFVFYMNTHALVQSGSQRNEAQITIVVIKLETCDYTRYGVILTAAHTALPKGCSWKPVSLCLLLAIIAFCMYVMTLKVSACSGVYVDHDGFKPTEEDPINAAVCPEQLQQPILSDDKNEDVAKEEGIQEVHDSNNLNLWENASEMNSDDKSIIRCFSTTRIKDRKDVMKTSSKDAVNNLTEPAYAIVKKGCGFKMYCDDNCTTGDFSSTLSIASNLDDKERKSGQWLTDLRWIMQRESHANCNYNKRRHFLLPSDRRSFHPHLLLYLLYSATTDTPLALESNRLITFNQILFSLTCSALRLANAGFFFNREINSLECYSCRVTVSYTDTALQKDPYLRHRELKPSCQHMANADTRNVFIQNDQKQAVSHFDITNTGSGNSSTANPQFHDIVQSLKKDMDISRQLLIKINISLDSQPHPSENTSVQRNDGTSGASLGSSSSLSETSTSMPFPSLSTGATIKSSNESIKPFILSMQETDIYPSQLAVANRASMASSPSFKPDLQPQIRQPANSVTNPDDRDSGQQTLGFNSSVPSTATVADDTSVQQTPSFGFSFPSPATVAAHVDALQAPRFHVTAPVHPNYADFTRRVMSLVQWPETHAQDPHALAHAGFYFVASPDCVRCHHCGLGLRSWEPGDNPLEEHARWRPSCEYLRSICDEQTINGILAGFAQREEGIQTRPAALDIAETTHVLPNGESAPSHQLSPAEERSRTIDDLMTSTTAARAREMGFTDDVIRQAVSMLVATRAGARAVTSQNLANAILYIRERGLSNGSDNRPDHRHLQDVVGDSDSDDDADPIPSRSPNGILGNQGDQSLTVVQVALNSESPVIRHSSSGSTDPADSTTTRGTRAIPGPQNDATNDTLTLEELERENQELRERQRCKICLEGNIIILFLPCGHLVCCADCASAVTSCPMCRVRIRGRVRTQLAPIPPKP